MLAQLKLRGPDSEGAWSDSEVGVFLGHRRLSIIDLSPAGHQPMVSANGRYVIALNGEIYNFAEIRKPLDAAGYPFHGHSDTEVALAAFEHYGFDNALDRFVGMFALALWDRESRSLLLARDRAGEKPLYYANMGERFVFASDLNAMRQLPDWSPRIDRDALGLLLRHYYVPAPRTIYADVHKLCAGEAMTVSVRNHAIQHDIRRYWAGTEVASSAAARRAGQQPVEVVEELDTLLRATIRDKMIADVPLGAFLSGGIDSSTIVALMQAESMGPVRTFSIGFDYEEFNEAGEAKRVAEHLGTEHTELYVTAEEAMAVIPRLPSLYSEPFADSSQIPTSLVSALARRDVTVALSGDGGDELFGGYNRYRLSEALWRRIARLPGPLKGLLAHVASALPTTHLDTLVAPVKPLLPPRWRHKQFGAKLHKLASLFSTSDEMDVYRTLISIWQQPSEVVLGATEIDVLAALPPAIATLPTFRERMMLIDYLTYLPDDILVKVDRASMGESLEVRVPFLDHRVFDYAWRIPIGLKVRAGESKWVLKQVLAQYVPVELFERPKMGFGVPLGHWLRGPLKEWAANLLDTSRLRDDGYFEITALGRLWEEHCTTKTDNSHLLWPILMFQAWLDEYER